jgi:ubiquinone/menaquinone biosynthesis C-methylase UbiE
MLELLRLSPGHTLVDLACGAGGPGLWAAHASGVTLIGVDPAASGLDSARRHARAVGLAERAVFREGSFERSGLPDGIADAVMTVEAFQYAPDKRAALAEITRILKPGGPLVIVCFEVDPTKVEGLPVLGVDPILDYTPLLVEAGFTIDAYEETPRWRDRVYSTFGALVDAADALQAEMGEGAAAVLAEAMLTVGTKPYPRRVLIAARRDATTRTS